MNITLLKYPTDEDWAFAKQCALVTIGKERKTACKSAQIAVKNTNGMTTVHLTARIAEQK